MQFCTSSIGLWMAILVATLSCHKPDEGIVTEEPSYRLYRLYYENSQGERAITTFHYDRAGMNYMAHWQLEDSSRSSLNYHQLDSHGNIIRKSRTFSDGITSEQVFKYDDEGRLARQEFNRSDGVRGETDYMFDAAGRLISADCRGLNGWIYGKIRYLYQDSIRAGGLLLQEADTLAWIGYTWDQDRQVREHWEFVSGFTQTYHWVFAREAEKTFTWSNVFLRETPWFRVSYEDFDFNGETGGPSHYHYNAEGTLETKEFIRSDGLSTVTRYVYDPTGILLNSCRAYDYGDTSVFNYWYGVNRQLLVRSWNSPDGSHGSVTFRYDEQGNLAEGIYENMDGWLNGTLAFRYDSPGILAGASFRGDRGEEANLSFFYDLDFNLTGIIWEFRNGVTQAYRFRWEPIHLQ